MDKDPRKFNPHKIKQRYCTVLLLYYNSSQNIPYNKRHVLLIIVIPYSRKISRAKIFEVTLPQDISRIKFWGSTRLSLHLYAIIRFSRINFRGSCEIHENSEIYCPRKIPAIRYNSKTVQYRCLILRGLNFCRFISMVIYEALYV